jgi:hypothetical protein
MTSRKLVLYCTALLSCVSVPFAFSKPIIPSPANSTAEFHVEGGLTFASGIDNVLNQMEKNFGFDRRYDMPVGLKLSAYAKFPSGFAIGGSVGPWTFISVEDRNHHYRYNDDYQWNYIVPVSADVRYFFPQNGFLAPYVRAGIAYPISGGDQIGSGTPGPVGAIGAIFWEHRIFSLGMEAGYDGSKVEVKSGYLHGAEKVRPTEFTFSIFASF